MTRMLAVFINRMRNRERIRVKTYRKEKIADVVRNIYSNTHIGEVKSIAQPDQRQSNNVMSHQLFEILPGFLQS